MNLLCLALSFLGFAVTSAGMERHAREILSAPASRRARRLRLLAGYVLLTLALAPAISAYGVSIGVAVWIGFLAVAATLVALLLTYRPHALRFALHAITTGLAALFLLGVLVMGVS
ncbi:MAG: DUF3325 domain-containing protein [Zoogloeaceae bacterium]|jgi:hypothetical protein|nr:DUF3325 domain-containing protein [Zoogloeaceae bacterium]